MLELEKERKKNAELATELEQVEDHRNRLLDKVERLHADKHNLEARYVRSGENLLVFLTFTVHEHIHVPVPGVA